MDKRRKKQFRALKKGHPVVSIGMFIFMCAAVTILAGAISSLIINYILDSKLGSEYNDLQYMARIYETSEKMLEADEVYDLLNEEGRDFFIVSGNGDVIYQHGVNTADHHSANVFISYMTDEDDENTEYSSKVIFRADTQIPLLYADDEGYIDFDMLDLLERLPDLVEETPEVGTTGKGNFVTRLLHIKPGTVAMVPFWFDLPVGTEGNILCGKAHIKINMIDFAWITMLFAALFLLVAILFVVIFVNLIRGLVRRRGASKIFFTDLSTRGRNWMWFLLRGETYLKSASAKKDTFAVVNLVFVNYRNYCVCHSIAAGDEILKRIDEWINARLQRKEMCARVNGAEFAVLLRFTDKYALEARIQEMIDGLQKIDGEHIFHFQAGVDLIGTAHNPSGKIIRRRYFDMEIAYNNACTTRGTMADSEESGLAFFSESMVENQRWVDQVQEKQRQAIENEEFKVYYQPKYDPQTDELKGAEALIRWISPEYGFIPPGKIIPIFEKNGFITEIDHYMVTHVARDQKRWLDQGFKCVPVSVNISRAHFIENDLAEQIRDMVDAEGTPHELVELELTESAFFDDKKALVETITRLKAYGFAVSMDDFGSGYSSLNSLKDMPLDVLKLDAEFFRGEDSGIRGEIVVSEAIRLAKSLNMRTVAEGVEVKEQVDFLASQGCDMIQGYYYAKPMPGNDYEERMNDNEDKLKRAARSVEASEYKAWLEGTLDISQFEGTQERELTEDEMQAKEKLFP
ncbi:MAG: GGDEF domain-containing phosphodiesterase [Lachnospiraceae bacterium]|nr:GGDEF domain-containing phosphodiesterase [Lachnospiraceae bacterium]